MKKSLREEFVELRGEFLKYRRDPDEYIEPGDRRRIYKQSWREFLEERGFLEKVWKQFASEFARVVPNEPESQNLVEFEDLTGLKWRHISEWRNPNRRKGWPDFVSLMMFAYGGPFSVDRLIFGEESHDMKKNLAKGSGVGVVSVLSRKLEEKAEVINSLNPKQEARLIDTIDATIAEIKHGKMADDQRHTHRKVAGTRSGRPGRSRKKNPG